MATFLDVHGHAIRNMIDYADERFRYADGTLGLCRLCDGDTLMLALENPIAQCDVTRLPDQQSDSFTAVYMKVDRRSSSSTRLWPATPGDFYAILEWSEKYKDTPISAFRIPDEMFKDTMYADVPRRSPLRG